MYTRICPIITIMTIAGSEIILPSVLEPLTQAFSQSKFHSAGGNVQILENRQNLNLHICLQFCSSPKAYNRHNGRGHFFGHNILPRFELYTYIQQKPDLFTISYRTTWHDTQICCKWGFNKEQLHRRYLEYTHKSRE